MPGCDASSVSHLLWSAARTGTGQDSARGRAGHIVIMHGGTQVRTMKYVIAISESAWDQVRAEQR